MTNLNTNQRRIDIIGLSVVIGRCSLDMQHKEQNTKTEALIQLKYINKKKKKQQKR